MRKFLRVMSYVVTFLAGVVVVIGLDNYNRGLEEYVRTNHRLPWT